VSLLELDHVSKRYEHGARNVEVLCDVSLEVHERELVAVWGTPRSGRSTLLRIAGGIEAPDSGAVRFRGRALAVGTGPIAGGIAYCQPALRSLEGQLVMDELIAAQLALGIRASGAKLRAEETLERVGARHCQTRRPLELDRAEEVRVSIARALLQSPSLLLIDEPIKGVDPLERDKILALLRSLTDQGMAVLMSTDKGIGLFGTHRALSLGEGRLRGDVTPEVAEVVPLRAIG
jgi:ABC-type multidrug transport system ATPase subunit